AYIVDDPVAPSFFPPNTLAMYGIATIQAYETVGFRNMWSETGYTTDPAALGEMGVTHAVSRPREELPVGWTATYRGERLTIWRNEHAVPRYLALPAGVEWVAGMGAGSGESSIAGTGGAPAATGEVAVSGTQNRRLLEVPPGTAALRVAENWSEGW